jgi:hypothetical protein
MSTLSYQQQFLNVQSQSHWRFYKNTVELLIQNSLQMKLLFIFIIFIIIYIYFAEIPALLF